MRFEGSNAVRGFRFILHRLDRIRAMLIRLRRLTVTALAIFCSSTLAYPRNSDEARGAAILQQTRTITEAALNQSLRQSGKLIVHAASKNIEGTYTHTSDGLLSRDEIVLPGYTEVRVPSGTQEKIQRPAAITTLSQSMLRLTQYEQSVG
jgi:hypothetical protein